MTIFNDWRASINLVCCIYTFHMHYNSDNFSYLCCLYILENVAWKFCITVAHFIIAHADVGLVPLDRLYLTVWLGMLEASWNVMAHAQKTDFIFRRNGQVHLNRPGLQFNRLRAAEVCTSVVVMLDTPCSEVVWRVLATHSIRQFPLHFPSHVSPCAITFQLESTNNDEY